MFVFLCQEYDLFMTRHTKQEFNILGYVWIKGICETQRKEAAEKCQNKFKCTFLLDAWSYRTIVILSLSVFLMKTNNAWKLGNECETLLKDKYFSFLSSSLFFFKTNGNKRSSIDRYRLFQQKLMFQWKQIIRCHEL